MSIRCLKLSGRFEGSVNGSEYMFYLDGGWPTGDGNMFYMNCEASQIKIYGAKYWLNIASSKYHENWYLSAFRVILFA